MKKLFAIATMAVMLCLAGLVMSGSASAQRCVDNHDGTVTDNGTVLMWQKATAGPMDWVQAMRHASNVSLAGHSDWWLPSKDELSSLWHPCSSLMEMESVPARYWTSTTYPNYPNFAFIVDFVLGFGGSNLKSDLLYVRAVRPAQ